MRDDALTMRGPVHGTKDAKRVAIGSSVGAVIETYDFIGFGTAAALYFGHAFLSGASPIARTLASFATLGVRGNPDTLVNNAAIITINDLEHTSVTDFHRVLQLRWWTFTQLEAGLPGAADTTEPGTELLPGIDEATRHAHRQAWAAAIDRSRTLPTAHDLDISA